MCNTVQRPVYCVVVNENGQATLCDRRCTRGGEWMRQEFMNVSQNGDNSNSRYDKSVISLALQGRSVRLICIETISCTRTDDKMHNCVSDWTDKTYQNLYIAHRLNRHDVYSSYTQCEFDQLYAAWLWALEYRFTSCHIYQLSLSRNTSFAHQMLCGVWRTVC